MMNKSSPLRLPPSVASRGLWIAQALLGFMGTLLLLFALALQARTTQWLHSVQQQIVFEIPAALDGEPPMINVNDLLRDLKNQSTLENVNLLQKSEIETTLKGWIDNVKDLPLPTLIEARVKDGADLTMVQYELDEHYKGVVFHLGKQAMSNGLQQVSTLRWAAYALVLIVIIVGAFMSLTAAYWRLDVQEDVLDLLHSMGASRTYIIQELARANFVQTLTSAGAGLISAFLLISITWLFSGKASPNDLQFLSSSNALAAIIVPLMLAIVAALATIYAVRLQYTAFRGVKE